MKLIVLNHRPLGRQSCLLISILVVVCWANAGCSRRQHPAVAEIQRLGGSVSYLEEDPRQEVIKIRLRDTSTSNADLLHLQAFSSLGELDLFGTKITDEGMAHLSQLTSLTDLNLANTEVTDEGLIHLQRLTNLKTLALGRQVTDKGLESLPGLSNLETLFLAAGNI